MKKEYVKPLAELIDFQPKDSIMGDLPLDENIGAGEGPTVSGGGGGNFDGTWD